MAESTLTFDGVFEVALEPTAQQSPLPGRFVLPEVVESPIPNTFTDTNTVVIMGLGRRESVIIDSGTGDGHDGDPVGYNIANAPDGRHFRTPVFPIIEGTLRVFLQRDNIERELIEDDINGFSADLTNGYFILRHPLEHNEQLRVQYVSTIDQNNPRVFREPDEVFKVHGAPSIETPLSLAANIAFLNGAQRVLAIQPAGYDVDPFWSDAFSTLELEQGYYLIVVPEQNILSIIQNALTHVRTSARIDIQQERVLLVGEVITETESLTRYDTEFLRDERVQFFAPEEATTVASGETAYINGLYLAAAAAGWYSAQPPVQSITNKRLAGFTLDRTIYKDRIPYAEQNELLDAGVTLIKPAATGGLVVRGITTLGASASIEQQEPTVVRIRDYLAKQSREVLAPFLGRLLTPQVVGETQTVMNNFLQGQVLSGTLKSFGAPSVAVDDVDPRQLNVEFTAQPYVPLLFIHVSFAVTV